MIYIMNALLIIGGVTALIGTLGCFRFKDFLSRTHAASIVETFSTLLIISALIIHSGFSLFSLKLIQILIFLYVTGSTAIHALTQAFLKHQDNKEKK